jgi:hypothetical protein
VATTDAWLSSDDIGWPFSFVNICHALGIDPGWLRRRIREQRDPARRLCRAA